MNTALLKAKPDPFEGKWAYLWASVLAIVCYILFSPFMNMDKGLEIHIAMFVAVLIVLSAVAVQFYYKTGDTRKIVTLIIVGGLIMRIGYMLYTSYAVRGHDVGTIYGNGHLGYIYNFFQNFTLPATNDYQFYHPPLFHFLAAVTAKVASIFTSSVPPESFFQVTKLVPCIASCIFLIVSVRLCRELRIGDTATLIAAAVIAFHPTFFILSASINNDMVMILFFLLSFLYTIRWYRNPTMKNILILALCIGLGMMTKVSAGTIAIFTAPVFALSLYKAIGQNRVKTLMGQFAAFIGVCFPLGLWYPIRNLILFKQPFSYVLRLSPESDLYCGSHSLVARFLSFPLDQLLTPVYCSAAGDYNLWLYNVKCSVFGEFGYGDSLKDPGRVLILANFALILFSLFAMVYVMICCKKADPFARFGLFALWLVLMVPFVQFNMAYPYGCTMDFRYIAPTVVIGAIYTGMAVSDLRGRGKKWSAALSYLGIVLVGAFIATSVFFYAA